MTIAVQVADIECPTCHNPEMHPREDWLLVRGFKFADKSGYWWSQCLVCAGYYDAELNVTEKSFDKDKGWF